MGPVAVTSQLINNCGITKNRRHRKSLPGGAELPPWAVLLIPGNELVPNALLPAVQEGIPFDRGPRA
jgi:hypothetical protein